MDNRVYTILLTSNRHGSTHSFRISGSWLKAILGLVLVFTVIFAAILVDYFGLLVESNHNKRLRAENTLLKRQFEGIRSKQEALEKALEKVKVYSAKLKLITKVDDDDRLMSLAMGPSLARTDEGSDSVTAGEDGERGPAAEFIEQEELFFEKPPLDEFRQELEVSSFHNDYATISVRIDKAVRDSQLREQSVLDLWTQLSERESLLNHTPSIKPARGWFTSRFGYRADPFSGKPVMHNGIDIAAAPGTRVYAPADGVVSHVGYEPGYGKLVTIDHGYGVKTRFAHNSQIFVKVGDKVERYTEISAIGSTGRSSGPHLHYEVRVHGIPVDPMNYILTE